MPAEKVQIERFLELAATYPVFDVRSPGEYNHAHVPGAYSLPLFTDEERKIIGTSYKQDSRQAAIKLGLDYFGPKMRSMVELVEQIVKQDKTVIIHCWRGGMRSAAVAWLLDLYGFKVYLLDGGYKNYRRWALARFEQDYELSVLGGYTGSGKTAVLKELQKAGEPVIDLEAIACHKGSAFGGLDEHPAPSQEMFDNLLACQLYKLTTDKPDNVIWVEDESQRIGLLNINPVFWKKMRASPIQFLQLDFELRLNNLVAEYGKHSKEKLVNAIMRIQKRLGGLETKNAINYLLEDNVTESFRILLRYYDKHYEKGLNKRERIEDQLSNVVCIDIDPYRNAKLLLGQQKEM